MIKPALIHMHEKRDRLQKDDPFFIRYAYRSEPFSPESLFRLFIDPAVLFNPNPPPQRGSILQGPANPNRNGSCSVRNEII